jgi:hypothetical protein
LSVQTEKIIKDATRAAGIAEDGIASHDFRRIFYPFLSKRGAMMIIEEVALQLNFGQTPTETIRKHYASTQDSEREGNLGELCRRALSHQTELKLYLAFERNMIAETDPDFRRAKDIFQRNSQSGEIPWGVLPWPSAIIANINLRAFDAIKKGC